MSPGWGNFLQIVRFVSTAKKFGKYSQAVKYIAVLNKNSGYPDKRSDENGTPFPLGATLYPLRDMSKPEFSMTLNTMLKSSEIRWHGVRLNEPDWSDQSHSISFTVRTLGGKLETHYILNAFYESLRFELPMPDTGRHWRRWIDTSLLSPNDINYWSEAPLVESQEYKVHAHTMVVLVNPSS